MVDKNGTSTLIDKIVKKKRINKNNFFKNE